MRILLKVLAVLAAIAFVIVTVPIVFTSNLFVTLTDREEIKHVLDSNNLVMELAPLALAEGIEKDLRDRGEPVANIDPDVMRQVLDEVVPPDWLAMNQTLILNALYDSVESGDITAAEVELDFRPILERIGGDKGKRAIRIFLESLPECPDPQARFHMSTYDLRLPGCLPADTTLDEATEMTHGVAIEVVNYHTQYNAEAGVLRTSLFGEAR